jgi:hypothetical protein
LFDRDVRDADVFDVPSIFERGEALDRVLEGVAGSGRWN